MNSGVARPTSSMWCEAYMQKGLVTVGLEQFQKPTQMVLAMNAGYNMELAVGRHVLNIMPRVHHNDLIRAWGLDMQLGYCSQGDRTVKVGVVDEEYIAHLVLPTLGSSLDNNMSTSSELSGRLALSEKSSDSNPHDFDNRYAIRLRSYAEMREFGNRWKNAVKKDECWVDPFRRKDPN